MNKSEINNTGESNNRPKKGRRPLPDGEKRTSRNLTIPPHLLVVAEKEALARFISLSALVEIALKEELLRSFKASLCSPNDAYVPLIPCVTPSFKPLAAALDDS